MGIFRSLRNSVNRFLSVRIVNSLKSAPGTDRNRITEKQIVRVLNTASEHQTAYRNLLGRQGVDIKKVTDIGSFQRYIPISDKRAFFSGTLLSDLIASRKKSGPYSLVTSSGFSKAYSFGISTENEIRAASFYFEELLAFLYKIQPEKLLVINCLSMGTELRLSRFDYARTGMRPDCVIALLQRGIGMYEGVALIGEPMFLKRVADEGTKAGIAWEKLRVFAITGGEFVPETMREYLRRRFRQDTQDPENGAVIVTMGISEIGLGIFFETHDLVALRKQLALNPRFRKLVCGSKRRALPLLMHYFPRLYFMETVSGERGADELVVTTLDSKRAIPLIRYNTGDTAVLFSAQDFGNVLANCGLNPSSEHLQALPVAAIWGRTQKVAAASGVALTAQEVKEVLYSDYDAAESITGNFRILNEKQTSGIRVLIQLYDSVSVKVRKQLGNRYQLLFSDKRFPPCSVSLVRFADFPYGRGESFDYKNRYAES